MRLALALLLVACRSVAPAPRGAPPSETEAEALARCAKEQPACRYLGVVPWRDPALDGCDERGVAPAPGDPCWERSNLSKNAERWSCWCDQCKADSECKPGEHCRLGDPCSGRLPFGCFPDPPPSREGCIDPR